MPESENYVRREPLGWSVRCVHYFHPPPPLLIFTCSLAVYRARDLSASAEAVEKGAFSREVEYAKTTSALYAIVLKEAQGVKGDIQALSQSVEGLAGGIKSARLVAARLAEVE